MVELVEDRDCCLAGVRDVEPTPGSDVRKTVECRLEEVASPSFAVLVSTTVSLVVATIAFRIEGRTFTGDLGSHKWFIAAGIAAGLSLHFLNSALQMGTLVAVVPEASAWTPSGTSRSPSH